MNMVQVTSRSIVGCNLMEYKDLKLQIWLHVSKTRFRQNMAHRPPFCMLQCWTGQGKKKNTYSANLAALSRLSSLMRPLEEFYENMQGMKVYVR